LHNDDAALVKPEITTESKLARACEDYAQTWCMLNAPQIDGGRRGLRKRVRETCTVN